MSSTHVHGFSADVGHASPTPQAPARDPEKVIAPFHKLSLQSRTWGWPNLDSPHEQKLGISDLHLPFIFPAVIFAFVQISRPRKVCTQTLSGATLLAMGCEASQAVANGLESSYEPGLLLPKIISHTPRKFYFQKCFNRFLCILSLPEHFKHLKMHIFLEKGTILFLPTPIFAPHLCSVSTATSW